MKQILFLFCLLNVLILKAQTQDSIYFWKNGTMIHKQSIKTADLDSITFKRPDVNDIPSITICNQVWSTKNLDVITYSDGTSIPQVTDPTEWASLTTGAWCYYDNDPANRTTYGKLYNWYAVVGIHDAASLNDPSLRKQLAPYGWHVPSDAEWTQLTDCLGGEAIAGGKMKSIGNSQAGTGLWQQPNTAATNESGFTGLPGGYRRFNGPFNYFGYYAIWWSSSEDTTTNAWYRYLNCNEGNVGRSNLYKKNGFSVRCLRD